MATKIRELQTGQKQILNSWLWYGDFTPLWQTSWKFLWRSFPLSYIQSFVWIWVTLTHFQDHRVVWGNDQICIFQFLIWISWMFGESVQFSSRWYLCDQKSPQALHPVSQKFPQQCLWSGSSVRLTDNGPLVSFHSLICHVAVKSLCVSISQVWERRGVHCLEPDGEERHPAGLSGPVCKRGAAGWRQCLLLWEVWWKGEILWEVWWKVRFCERCGKKVRLYEKWGEKMRFYERCGEKVRFCERCEKVRLCEK